jgi:beta-glucosidase
MKISKLIAFVLISVFMQNIQAQNPVDLQKMNSFISDLMSKMTVEEKIGQLNLVVPLGFTATGATFSENVEKKIRAGEVGAILNSSIDITMKAQELATKETRMKIPILFGRDVIHGFSTIFPIPLAMACTWDMALIEKSARIAATEASANGINWTYSPMVDIARDARWGRIAEGAGEDAWLGSQVAKALVKGYQGDDLAKENTIMACVKHYAMYGAAEAGRDYNTVDMSRLSMYQDYLPPYKAAVDAGAGSVMTSFNVVDAIPATGNRWLMTDVLRTQWGFNGFVVTDYTAINEMIQHGMGDLQAVAALALKAGVDMDMVGEAFLGTLKKSLEEGKVTQQEIDQACRRVLVAKYKLGLFDDPFRYLKKERLTQDVLTVEHLATARQIATRSIVLLKNDKQTLPLKKSGTISVIGPLADSKPDMLGTWAMTNETGIVVTVLEGIKNAVGTDINVLYAKGANITDDPYLASHIQSYFGSRQETKEKTISPEEMLREAVETAKNSDVIVAVLGESVLMSGEAASRSDLDIPESQKNLLKYLIITGKPVVLVLVNGRPLTLLWENENVPAIVETWAGGTEAGNAIADVLFGDYNPAGKLTATFPLNVGQIPIYYNHKNTGRPMDPRNKFTSKYLDVPNDPLYPFGYGLSYTTFDYSDIRLDKNELSGNDVLNASVTITNTGNYAGEEVVQLYIRDPVASISRPVKELKNYKKIMLQPGEKTDVNFTITCEDLKFYNSELKYTWEPGEFVIFIGTNSRDVKSATVKWGL